ncbi:MAG: single-stranded DNA-binding protein [Bacilli bacterium]
MNKVILVGRLARDPDLRYPSSNVPVVNFTIAIDRPFTNKDGVREADFIGVTAFRNQAENIKKYVGKGSLVSVEGSIRVNSYQKDGQTVYSTNVIAENVRFLSTNRPTNSNGHEMSNNTNNVTQNSNPSNQESSFNIDNDPYANFGNNVEITDDLPFN